MDSLRVKKTSCLYLQSFIKLCSLSFKNDLSSLELQCTMFSLLCWCERFNQSRLGIQEWGDLKETKELKQSELQTVIEH